MLAHGSWLTRVGVVVLYLDEAAVDNIDDILNGD